MNIAVCLSVLEYAKEVDECTFLELWSTIVYLTEKFEYKKYWSSDLVLHYLFDDDQFRLSHDVITSIQSYFHLAVNVNYQEIQSIYCNASRDSDMIKSFNGWLNKLLDDHGDRIQRQVDRNKFILGVVTVEQCNGAGSASCNRVIILNEQEEKYWISVKPNYYYLRFTDYNLPISGDHPYKPPKRWHTFKDNLGSRSTGFIDSQDRRWVWATHHGVDHWDLQLPNGNHLNVLPNGMLKGGR